MKQHLKEECAVYHLRPESLTQNPLDRLAEASSNLHWALADLDSLHDPEAAMDHHWDVTPVHEAAHAVAGTLAGRSVKHVLIGHFLAPVIRRVGAQGDR
ncbi:hypothetical protein [Xanthobacter versatilis]|uniref:hypothetical protein n=1 Tax=Xanthobacter autotrophicus (strain ATCC BAA-1158 / Py2) TaxID=78245 RepID=UPI00372919EA